MNKKKTLGNNEGKTQRRKTRNQVLLDLSEKKPLEKRRNNIKQNTRRKQEEKQEENHQAKYLPNHSL